MTRAGRRESEDRLAASAISFVRALWGLDVRVRALPTAASQLAPPRPSFVASNLWLPASPLARVPGSFSDYLFAASAHISAHLRFGATRFFVNSLKPVQIAIISLLEDARVERLAMAEYPGLARLWAPYFEPRVTHAKTSLSLLERLAHALHDDAYVDDDSWVNKARRAFLAERAQWHDSSFCRRIGSALGNDLGQMRVQFNAKDYAVLPAYRDDNVGLWQFEQERSEHGTELETEAARPLDSERAAARLRTQSEAAASSTQGQAASERSSSPRPETSAEGEPATLHPEWDYVIGRERPAFCSVKERPLELGDGAGLAAALARYAPVQKRLERSALCLASRRPTQVRRLLSGDRLDLPAAIAATVAQASAVPADARVYRRVRFPLEPPGLLLLLDLSESLNERPAGATSTLLELARTAGALLASSLAVVAGDLAIHGFSSNGRHDVGYYRFKDFEQPYDERTQARLAGMRANSSTRLGGALRHAGRALATRSARRKLLLVVSDGEPSDIDVHDPEYLLLDAKQATIANRRLGVTTFCLGLDPNAEESVKRIFGAGYFSLIEQQVSLPQRLSQLYLRLSA